MSTDGHDGSDSDRLLPEIGNCPVVEKCLADPAAKAPCAKVVGAQARFDGEHVLPEPWSGDRENAPILFVSSNPSIAGSELVPRVGWSDDDIVDFYRYRFGGGSREWIKDGIWGLKQDGTYGKNLGSILGASASRVLFVLGEHARGSMVEVLGLAPDRALIQMSLAGEDRYVAFIPHANARTRRTLAACLSVGELTQLRGALVGRAS